MCILSQEGEGRLRAIVHGLLEAQAPALEIRLPNFLQVHFWRTCFSVVQYMTNIESFMQIDIFQVCKILGLEIMGWW